MTPLATFAPPSPLRWSTRLWVAGGISAAIMAFVVLTAGDAHGQVVGPGALNAVVNAFTRVQGMEGALLQRATELFGALAVCSAAVIVGRWIKGSQDFGELASALVDFAIVTGIFWFALTNAGDIFRAIVQSFVQLGNEGAAAVGGSQNMSPSDVVGVGINTTKVVWDAISLWSPVQSTLLIIGGFLILCAYAYLTALMMEVIIEGMIITAASIIFMGFGGSHWTRDVAVAMVRAIIGVGAKRLYIQVMIGVCEAIVRDLANAARSGALDYVTLSVLVLVPIAIGYVCKSVPARAQAILNGAYVGGDGLSRAYQAGAKAATAAAIGATGVGAAVASGVSSAQAAIAAREATAAATGGSSGVSSSAIGRAAQVAGLAAGNTARALASDVGNRLSGNYAANHGHTGFRVARMLSGAQKQSEAQTARANQAASQQSNP